MKRLTEMTAAELKLLLEQKEQEEAIARKAICEELNMAKNFNGGMIPKVLEKFLLFCD